jgi:polyisoprenoid-binding protein YceI
MRPCCAFAGAALVASAAALLPHPSQARPPAAPGTYSIDPVHSSVAFRIKHMNIAPFYGQFDEMTGSVNFDAADPTKSSIETSIKVESVNTHNGKRNDHLKSPDFFNAAKFPTMEFKSKSFAKSGENAFDVAGDLTIHGVTKPVTIKLEKTGEGKTQMGERIGFGAEFTVKRSDYGITFMPDGLGDEVKVALGIEAVKK